MHTLARMGEVGELLALVLLLTTAAFAQLTTADILGTVTDASGAVIANATVVVTNTGTNEARTTTTNGSGDYNFTLLPVGHYSISVKATGFQEAITKDLSVPFSSITECAMRLYCWASLGPQKSQPRTALVFG